MHASIHPYIHTYMHACMHTYIHTCIHTYMHACIHTYIHAYIHTYIHTFIHWYSCFSAHVLCTLTLNPSKHVIFPWSVLFVSLESCVYWPLCMLKFKLISNDIFLQYLSVSSLRKCNTYTVICFSQFALDTPIDLNSLRPIHNCHHFWTSISNASTVMNIVVFDFTFHWSLFPMTMTCSTPNHHTANNDSFSFAHTSVTWPQWVHDFWTL